MKTIKIFYLMFLTLITLIVIGCNKNSDKIMTTISVRQEWFPNSNYSGELVAAKKYARENNIDIKVEAGSDNIDPIKLVISGNNDIGVVGADKVFAANQNGADLVIIGVVNYNSPTCFISLADKNIKTAKDFENRKIGILTGTATEYVYRALVKKAGLNEKNLKEVEAPFDLATFISGEYDVRPAFIYDEPVSLDLQNIKYLIIKPEDYGVEFLGTVYFTTQKMITEKPEIIQSFVNSVIKGWEYTLNNPEEAIKYLKEFDQTIDEKRELASLKKGLPYYKGFEGKILFADKKHWVEMANTLIELELIKSVDLNKSLNDSFVNKYYSLEKK